MMDCDRKTYRHRPHETREFIKSYGDKNIEIERFLY
jgi:hypothetical protein